MQQLYLKKEYQHVNSKQVLINKFERQIMQSIHMEKISSFIKYKQTSKGGQHVCGPKGKRPSKHLQIHQCL